jgi:lactoylglutathione lyase
VPFRDAFPIFQTVDLSRAVAFYRDLFGFKEGYRFPAESPEFVVVVLGPFSLGLSAVDEIAPAGRVALWLYCDDLDEEVARLREAGVEVVKEPEDQEWGERLATVVDRDGNEIHLGQRR